MYIYLETKLLDSRTLRRNINLAGGVQCKHQTQILDATFGSVHVDGHFIEPTALGLFRHCRRVQGISSLNERLQLFENSSLDRMETFKIVQVQNPVQTGRI